MHPNRSKQHRVKALKDGPEELPASERRSPFIQFKPNRSCGNKIVEVSNVTHSVDGVQVLANVSFVVENGDKVAIADMTGNKNNIVANFIWRS